MTQLNDFKAYMQSLDRSPATVRGYLTDLTVFTRWLDRDLASLASAIC
jgi:hypothetical protein